MVPVPAATPLFSIIVGVYNDWVSLEQCLRSLAEQSSGPSFEAIVVDDGGSDVAPEYVRDWISVYPLTLIRQTHAGISAARNRGIQASRGSVLVFVDADCKFQPDCLATLGATITQCLQHNCFQLHLVGDCSGIVGRAEQLRLITLQNHLLQPDGCIRYLNTAGFAIRRAKVDIEKGLFDPVAVRAEDTLLLANLIEAGELPLFVANATVQHAVPLSLLRCFRKAIRAALMEARTYQVIAQMGVTFRVSQQARLRMLLSMWKTSGQPSIGRLAFFVVATRQSLRLIIHFLGKAFPWGFRSAGTPNRISVVDHGKTGSN